MPEPQPRELQLRKPGWNRRMQVRWVALLTCEQRPQDWRLSWAMGAGKVVSSPRRSSGELQQWLLRTLLHLLQRQGLKSTPTHPPGTSDAPPSTPKAPLTSGPELRLRASDAGARGLSVQLPPARKPSSQEFDQTQHAEQGPWDSGPPEAIRGHAQPTP